MSVRSWRQPYVWTLTDWLCLPNAACSVSVVAVHLIQSRPDVVLLQRQLATQMLHQQQLLQRAAAQQAQHGQQPETVPSVWRASQAMSNAPAASPAVQWQPQQGYSQTQQNGQVPGKQASGQGQH